MLPQNTIDIIATQILFDAKAALASLKAFNANVQDAATRVATLKALIQSTANQLGGDFKRAEASVSAFANSLTGIKPAEVKQAGREVQQLGNRWEETSKKTKWSIDVIRTALGVLTAMLINVVLTAFVKFFRNVSKDAEKLRGKLAELNFAESILSQKGMDITRAELDKFISDIEEKVKYLSTLEVTGIVADVANMGAEFKLAKKDVVGLAEAVAFIQLSEKAFGQEISDSGSIINAALDARSNYFNKLGINITKTAVKEKAYEMGLAEHGAAISKEVSNQAAIALLIEQTSGKFDELLASIEKVNPALANQMRVTKKSKDAQLEIGEAVLRVKDAWNSFLSVLIKRGSFDELVDNVITIIDAFAGLIELISSAQEAYNDFSDAIDDDGASTGFEKWLSPLRAGLTLLQLIFLGLTSIIGAIISTIGVAADLFALLTGKKNWDEAGWSIGQHLSDGILAGLNTGLKPLLEGKNDPVSNAIRNTMEKLNAAYAVFDPEVPEIPDTPTIPTVADEDIVSPEALAALDELEDDLLEIAADAETARRELQILTQQKYDDIRIDAQIKLEEIELKFQQDVADAERELQQEIDDIHIEARQAEADAKRQAREDELRAEAEFQQKMKELRQRFLMDLEEALHARDARQVLKLIKQYEFEKQQAKERKELDDKLRKERLQAELESIRIEEQRRVEAAQREFARKMQELEIEKQREIEAANEAEKQKLEELARWNAAEMEEIDRHAKDKMEKLTAAYEAEFGAHKLYQEMINRVIAEYTAANIRAMQDMYNYMVGLYAQIGAMYASSQGMLNSMGGVVGAPQPQNPFPYHPGGYAEGGSVIAMRPTRAIFGERGPELATFTPLGRDGRDVNKLFGDLPSSAGGGGRMLIEMLLSPDLEARVIENSLSRTADIFARVSRSK